MEALNKYKKAVRWELLCFILLAAIFSPGRHLLFSSDSLQLQIEKFQFHDWQISISSEKAAKVSCDLHFTGVSRGRILLSMRLSMVKEHRASSDENGLTILKITAGQIKKNDSTNTDPIPIKDAWIETTTETTLGKINKIDVGVAPHFLAGREGLALFFGLLRGIRKDGIIIGYRTKTGDRAKIFQASAPPSDFFEKLKPCLAKMA